MAQELDGDEDAKVKRRRVDGNGEKQKDLATTTAATAAAVAEELEEEEEKVIEENALLAIHISALLDDLRPRILRHFPLRDAVRTSRSARSSSTSRSAASLLATCTTVYRDAQPFHGLEEIRFHSIVRNPFMGSALIKMLALCPRLHTLDLCNFFFPAWFDANPFIMPVLENLRTITLAECRRFTFLYTKEVPKGVREVPSMGYFRCTTGSHDAQRFHLVKEAALLTHFPGLHSFRYSGDYAKSPLALKEAALLTKLYICLRESITDARQFNRSLPKDLSALTVLTICSNTIKITCSLLKGRGNAAQTRLRNLHSLRELQLLMFEMKTDNLADISLFLKSSQCASLERLFVQLPDITDAPLKCLLKCLLKETTEVDVEPPENGLGNLRITKVMNFNWSCAALRCN
ncbi:hypothetical protein ACP4OV_013915 [Aristida adscensionis]